MNKKTLITIIIAAILIGAGVFYFTSTNKDEPATTNQNKTSTSDAKKFKEEYPGVVENNLFVYKTAAEVINILENGSGLVYLGFPECPWCQKYVVYLDEIAREQNVNQIAYFNVRQIRTDNTAEYQKLVQLMGDYLDKDDNGKPRIFVPDLVAVQNGKIVGHDNTTSLNTSADGTPNEWWTEERVTNIKQKIREIIREAELCDDVCQI